MFESADGNTKQEKILSATNLFLHKYEIDQSNNDAIHLRFKRMVDNKPKNNRDGIMVSWNSHIFMRNFCIVS